MRAALVVSVLLACLGHACYGQSPSTVQCSVATTLPAPTLRAEGKTELISDLVVTCTGGVPGQVVSANFSLALNTTITSPVIVDDHLDALLLVGEPTPLQQQLNTNVFAGVQPEDRPNQVLFQNVRIPLAGSSATRIRITNVRADVALLGAATRAQPTSVVAFLAYNVGGAADATQAVVGVGVPSVSGSLQDGQRQSASPTVPCAAQNTHLLTADTGTATPTFHVTFAENTGSAFRPQATRDPAGAVLPQAVPGQLYHTESGFFNPLLTDGFAAAGRAASGTRLLAHFTHLSAGVRLFVGVTPTTATDTLAAVLLSATAEGQGPYQAATATASTLIGGKTVGLAPLSIVNGSATAVWEVTASGAASLDSFAFAVAAAYPANAVSAATWQVQVALAPLAPPTAALTLPAPHFVRGADTPLVVSAPSCRAVAADLAISATGPATASTGTALAVVTTVHNQGTGAAAQVGVQYSLVRAGVTPVVVAVTSCIGIAALAVGATRSCTDSLTLPYSVEPGAYELVAVADPALATDDADRANNRAGYPLTVLETPCSIELRYSDRDWPANYNGVVTVEVVTPGCAWSAQSDAPWLTVAGNRQLGTQILRLQLAANTTPQARTARLTVGTVQLTIRQSTAVATAYVTAVSPVASRSPQEVFTLRVGSDLAVRPARILVSVGSAGAADNGCQVEHELSDHALVVRLQNAIGLTAASAGQVVQLVTAACSLNVAEAAFTWQGNTGELRLPLTMRVETGAKVNLFVKVLYDAPSSAPWYGVGAWWPSAAAGQPVNRYRLFGTVTRGHLHTTDLNEYNVLGTTGIWVQEGITGRMLNAPGAYNGVAAIPFYRIYKEQSRTHFWTSDQNEYLTLIRLGGIYTGEGIDGLLLASPAPGTVPLYRLAHQYEVPVLHHWTTDLNEYNVLAERNWRQEGVTGYLAQAP